jgi:hypothetical protein
MTPSNALIDHLTIEAAYHRGRLADAEKKLADAIAEARGTTTTSDSRPVIGDSR